MFFHQLASHCLALVRVKGGQPAGIGPYTGQCFEMCQILLHHLKQYDMEVKENHLLTQLEAGVDNSDETDLTFFGYHDNWLCLTQDVAYPGRRKTRIKWKVGRPNFPHS